MLSGGNGTRTEKQPGGYQGMCRTWRCPKGLPWWGWLETSVPLLCSTGATPGSEIYEQADENYSVGKDQLLQVLERMQFEVRKSLSLNQIPREQSIFSISK